MKKFIMASLCALSLTSGLAQIVTAQEVGDIQNIPGSTNNEVKCNDEKEHLVCIIEAGKEPLCWCQPRADGGGTSGGDDTKTSKPSRPPVS